MAAITISTESLAAVKKAEGNCMITLADYLQNPCGTLSIPYWKAAALEHTARPAIVHARDFVREQWVDYDVTPYFRLLHTLRDIPDAPLDCAFALANHAHEADDREIAKLLRACYPSNRTKAKDIAAWRDHATYAARLWVVVQEQKSGKMVACGIAELDTTAREGALEWIQVLPAYQRRGIGRHIVCELLRRMRGRADFATVSGSLQNQTNPEALYRACGFQGSDVWYVCTVAR
jgi:ribosomal protein S18 acetylase RimI-like enzyme